MGIARARRIARRAHQGQLRYDHELLLDQLERVADAVAEQGGDWVAVQAAWLHAVPASVEDLVLQGVPSRVVQVVKALRSYGWSAPAQVRHRAALVREAMNADRTVVSPSPAEPADLRTLPELLAEYGETRDYRIQWAINRLLGEPNDLNPSVMAELAERWWDSADDWEAGVAVRFAHRAGLLDRERLLRTVADGVPAAAETAIGLLEGEGDGREIEVLRTALLRPELEWLGVRTAVRVRLTAIGTPEAVAALRESEFDLVDMPWRHDRDWLHRNGTRLIPRLVELLPDPYWWHDAPVALASLRATEAVGPMCETVRVAEHPIPMIQALGGIGSAEAGPTLVWLLGHESAEVRAEALQALSRTGGADVVEVAMAACDDPDVQVRDRAARVLARHADGRAVTTLIRLCDTARAAEAADALTRIGDPRALPTLWSLFSHHHDRAVRHAAGRGLVRIEGEQRWSYVNDPRVERAYMWLLGHKPDWHRGALVIGTKHSDAMVRTRAVEAFGRLRDPAGAEHVRPLIADPDRRVRAAARAVTRLLGD
ncbi:HEAT repeat domain-containing protein [Lentzea sp. BCCO 10_0856]|uniref:HEAT repeat domain-containing protein n=1 Tax=Lentzea miocenica TaxID=3095431 RepID=A0ABU4SSK9_9PSEU|nr:HEAT repeat domain-containing protein [Lentzea sp. BCCO 10_0856]MDX8028882.1 HEAT repeat domain-containing protein [Lentzea sp. BCCO 10_0856]